MTIKEALESYQKGKTQGSSQNGLIITSGLAAIVGTIQAFMVSKCKLIANPEVIMEPITAALLIKIPPELFRQIEDEPFLTEFIMSLSRFCDLTDINQYYELGNDKSMRDEIKETPTTFSPEWWELIIIKKSLKVSSLEFRYNNFSE